MITEARATRILRQLLPDAAPRRMLWSSAFRLGQGQSHSYRRGRWLLAGDAAHSMGPSAGAGMMIGILAAWRLGLRLAEVMTGGSDEPLNRYEAEQCRGGPGAARQCPHLRQHRPEVGFGGGSPVRRPVGGGPSAAGAPPDGVVGGTSAPATVMGDRSGRTAIDQDGRLGQP